MADIKVEIQGQDAAAATEALLAIPGRSGSWETIAGIAKVKSHSLKCLL